MTRLRLAYLWLVLGAIVGFWDAYTAPAPFVTFYPQANWILRTILYPCVYGTALAAGWLAVTLLARLVCRALGCGESSSALALGLFTASLTGVCLATVWNVWLDARLASIQGLLATVLSFAGGASFGYLVFRLARRASVEQLFGAGRRVTDIAVLALLPGLSLLGGVAGLQMVRGNYGPPTFTGEINRVFILGLDGADWSVLWPLVQDGSLPNMRRLVLEGFADHVYAVGGANTPMVWTSIATGRHPDAHGIHDHTIKPPGAYEPVPVASVHRRVPAIWNMLTQLDRDSVFVDYPVTHPPEAVRGLLVTHLHAATGPVTNSLDRGRELPAACVPPALENETPSTLTDRAEDADARLKRLRTLTLCLMDHSRAWTVFASYTHTTDAVQHLFWRFAFPNDVDPAAWPPSPPALTNVIQSHWEKVDEFLGEIVTRLDTQTLLIIVSDHGAQALLEPKRSLDVNRLLAHMGWAELDRAGELTMETSRAYDAGFTPFQERDEAIALNVVGREPGGIVRPEDFDASLDSLRESLQGLRTASGKRLFDRVDRAIDVSQASRAGSTSFDLLCTVNLEALRLGSDHSVGPDGRPSDRIPLREIVRVEEYSGTHRDTGVLVAWGPNVLQHVPSMPLPETHAAALLERLRSALLGPPKVNSGLSSYDVTPTILYALGLPISRQMEGRASFRIFSTEFLKAQAPRWTDSYEFDPPTGSEATAIDEKELEHLRALGYIR